ncbi:MAG: patatin-like phospholipase family protein [Ahrensia sp.]|nr:patatin-like phospholipase family protein [Ahrensia sp.]
MAKGSWTKRKKLNLALQGGGAHGAYTWGVLDRLLEDGRIDLTGISGTSIGAINATVMADGLCTGDHEKAREKLADFWEKMGRLSYTSPIQRMPWSKLTGNWTLNYSPGRMMMDAITNVWSPYEFNPMNFNPLHDLIESEIDFERVRKNREFELFVCATNVKTGKTKVFAGEELTADAVMASSCLPEYFHAVEIDGEHYWDGGFMGNPPLFPLFYRTNCADVLLIQINPVEIEEVPKTAFAIHNRVNEITFNATLLRELRTIEFVSRLIDEGKLGDQYMQVRMHAIPAAREMLDLSASSKLNLEPAFLDYLKNLGRASAEAFLECDFDRVGKEATLDLRAMFS